MYKVILLTIMVLVYGCLFSVVISKSKRRLSSLIHNFLTVSLALWSLGLTMFYVSNNSYSALFWTKMLYFSGNLIAFFYLYFSLVFPEEKLPNFFSNIFLLFPTMAIFCFYFFTSLILKGVILEEPRGFIYGPYRFLFDLHFISYFLFAFINFIRKFISAHGVLKSQINYMFLGAFLGVLMAGTTNIFLPWFLDFKYLWLGPFLSLPWPICNTYAIVRHRLMDIEVIIKRATVFAGMVAGVALTYSVIIFVGQWFLTLLMGKGWVAMPFVAAVAVVLVLPNLQRWLERATDRIFFMKKYDYRSSLRKASEALTSVTRIERLARLIAKITTRIMRITGTAVILHDRVNRNYFVAYATGDLANIKNIIFGLKNSLIEFLKEEDVPAVRDDLLYLAESGKKLAKQKNKTKEYNFQAIVNQIDSLKAEIVVPSISQDELVGALCLGQKKSGDLYSQEDLDLLMTLAKQGATAVRNAHIYEEIWAERQFRENIIKSMPVGNIIVSLDGLIIGFNQTAEKATGFERIKILNKSWEKVWENYPEIAQIVPDILEKETEYVDREYKFVQRLNEEDEITKYFIINARMLKTKAGEPLCILAALADYTTLKNMEHQVRMSEKLSSMGTMAAIVAHELNNPLTYLRANIDALSNQVIKEKAIDLLKEQGPVEIKRLESLVKELSSFSRWRPPKFSGADINEIINTVDSFLEPIFISKQVKVHFIKELNPLPIIFVDVDRMKQLFINLIMNAFKAIEKEVLPGVKEAEGEIKINTRYTRDFGPLFGNGAVQISVSDTGRGIPKHLQKHIFDQFVTTASPDEARGAEGIGLGLYIVSRIINEHKGKIDLQSEIGKGTTFIVSLPVKKEN